MILKLGMKHQAMELYKIYINHDPGMTLTFFTARSPMHLNGEKSENVIEWQKTFQGVFFSIYRQDTMKVIFIDNLHREHFTSFSE